MDLVTNVVNGALSKDGLPDEAEIHEGIGEAAGAVLRPGRWTRLVVLNPHHNEFIYRLALEVPETFRWKFGVGLPSFDEVIGRLSENVLSQLAIVEKQTGAPIGLVAVYGADFNSRFATLGIALLPEFQGHGLAGESIVQFIHHIFTVNNFRKLYVRLPGYLRSPLGQITREEGRLSGHVFAQGRKWDELILSIDRQRFYKHYDPASGFVLQHKSGTYETEDDGSAPLATKDLLPSYPSEAADEWEAATEEATEIDPEDSAANLVGKWVQLVPCLPSHTEFLYDLSVMDEESFRWRYQGAILTRETFQAQLWRGVLCQFVVSTVKSGRPIGFVISYRADLNAGHAYLGGMMTREARRTGIGLEAFSLFIRYIRRTWNINKLYVEFPDFNSPQFASGLISEAKEEARIRDHLYFDGQFWDYRYFSISG